MALAGASKVSAAAGELPWVKAVPTIEQLTGGKVHTGEVVNAKNVSLVRSYLLESWLRNVQDGATFTIVPTTPSALLVPATAVKATMRMAGKASIDANGTVITKDGKSWSEGFPAACPKTAVEVLANMSYVDADQVHTLEDEFWISPQGEAYKDVRAEVDKYSLNGRTCIAPTAYVPGYDTEEIRTLIYDLSPYDHRHTADQGQISGRTGMQLTDVFLIEATPRVPYIYSKNILEVDAATYNASGDFYDKQGRLWIGFHTIYTPGKCPCGNDVKAIAYIFHNYQTGGVTLNTTDQYVS